MSPALDCDTEIEEGGRGGGLKHLQDRMCNVKCIEDEATFNNPLSSLSISVSAKKIIHVLFLFLISSTIATNTVSCTSSPPTNTSGVETACMGNTASAGVLWTPTTSKAERGFTYIIFSRTRGISSSGTRLISNFLKIPLCISSALWKMTIDLNEVISEMNGNSIELLTDICRIICESIILLTSYLHSFFHDIYPSVQTLFLGMVQCFYSNVLHPLTWHKTVKWTVRPDDFPSHDHVFPRALNCHVALLGGYRGSIESVSSVGRWVGPAQEHVHMLSQYPRIPLVTSFQARPSCYLTHTMPLLTLGLLLCLVVSCCIALTLSRRLREPMVVVTHYHNHFHTHYHQGVPPVPFSSSPLHTTDCDKSYTPCRTDLDKKNSCTSTNSALEWDTDTSFAFHPPSRLTDDVGAHGSFTISAEGPAYLPVSTEPTKEKDQTPGELSESEEDTEATSPTSSRNSILASDRLRQRLASGDWGSLTTTDESELSSQSSAGSETDHGKRKAKWIHVNGEYPLDRGETSHIALVTEYMNKDSCNELTKELANAINKTCKPRNKDRFKIELFQDAPQKLTDVPAPKKAGRTSKMPAVSILSVDLNEKSELSTLAKVHLEKASKHLLAVFGKDAEFDSATIHRFSGPQHKIPYTGHIVEGSAFSPIVMILSIGSISGRPLFIRANPGGIVGHKVTLNPASLCVLSGRAAANYKYSLPKDWGNEGEHYLMVFSQKVPNKCILDELEKIENPVVSPAVTPASPPPPQQLDEMPPQKVSNASDGDTSNEIDTSQPIQALKESEPIKLLENLRIDCKAHSQEHCKSTISETPETAIPTNLGFSFDFKDAVDTEPSSTLILAETLESAINKMDQSEVTAELMRNQASSTGNLEQMKTRLKHRISISIGELQTQASVNNSSLLLNQLTPSPRPDQLFLQEVIQKVLNKQEHVDNTLEAVLGNLKKLQDITTTPTDPQTMTSPDQVLQEDLKKAVDSQERLDKILTKVIEKLDKIQDTITTPPKSPHSPCPDPAAFQEEIKKALNSQVKIDRSLAAVLGYLTKLHSKAIVSPSKIQSSNCISSDQIADLTNIIKETRASVDIHSNQLDEQSRMSYSLITEVKNSGKSIDAMSQLIKDCDDNMQKWRESAFSDEATAKISVVHEYVMQLTIVSSDKSAQTDTLPDLTEHDQHGEHTNHTSVHCDQLQDDREITLGTVLTPDLSKIWSNRKSALSLEKAVEGGKDIKVCLISDSIMRHIDSLEMPPFSVVFERIDCTDSKGLLAGSTMDALKVFQPHVVYIHLGINDIHQGASHSDVIDRIQALDNFLQDNMPDTKIIISLPLPNGKSRNEGAVTRLRSDMALYGNMHRSNTRRLLEFNMKFLRSGPEEGTHQNPQFFQKQDHVHLSQRGKNAIQCTMRNRLYRILMDLVPRGIDPWLIR